MEAEAPIHESITWKNESWLGIAATAVALLCYAAIGVLLAASVILNRTSLGALALWGAIPVAAFGLVLAILGLMHRGRAHKLAHHALWHNGAIAILAPAAAMAWSLAR